MRAHIYGAGTIYPRAGSPFWWASYYLDGKGHKQSTGIRMADDPEKTTAQRWLHKRQIAAEAGSYVPTAARLTFEEMADALITKWTVDQRRAMKSLRASVSHLRRYFGHKKALAITGSTIERYKLERLGAGAAAGTVNHELAVLRRMLNLARKAGQLPNPPAIEMLPVNNARQGFVEAADFERLLAALPEHAKGLVEFLYLTSWRAGEGRTLEWGDVDLPNRAIRLKAAHSKNGEARLIKLGGRLLEVIEHAAILRRLDCPYVFHRAGHPLTDCRRSWRAATKAAGLGGLLLHDLRRSGVRNMVRAGVSESVAMKISGHKTRTIFKRYDITDERDLDEAAAAVDAYLNVKRQEPAKVAVLADRRVA